MSDQENQSPRGTMRWVQKRQGVFIDEPDVALHSASAATDLPASGAKVWSKPLDVRGVDAVHLFVDYTKGAADSLGLGVQFSPGDTNVDSEWFDNRASLAVQEGDDGAIETANDPTYAGATGRFVITVNVHGNWMRIAPYGNGASKVGSRCTIRAVRYSRSS